MLQTALVTGSASGLAVAFARRLAENGFALALNYRESRERCEALAAELREAHGVHALPLQADMTKGEEIHRMMDVVESEFGSLDVLVHSAGPFVFTRKRLTEYTETDWHLMIDGNLTSAFHLFQRAIPLMRPQGYGRIITIGFDRVEQSPGWAYRSAYAAAKVGLASLTRTVALEERENGITANMICPGDIRGSDKEAQWPEADSWYPLRQPVGADLSHVVAFLVSKESQFVTGNVINVAGETDVINHFDQGKPEVVDRATIAVGATVRVIPWNRTGVIVQREDRHNRRSIYTVDASGATARFTIDQLLEVTPDGL